MSRPRCSVLIASVSGDPVLFDALAALDGEPELQVVIADRVGGEFAERLSAVRASFELRVLDCPRAAIPALRLDALRASDGELVAVIEDHCVPGGGWLDALLGPLRQPDVVLTWGPVRDALRGTAWDRAAFLCDYAAFLPGNRPATPPGMNTAYRRPPLERLLDAEPELSGTFWEGPLHRRLAMEGRCVFVPDAGIGHRKAFPAELGLRQRFLQGRHLGGRRQRGLGVDGRAYWAAAAATLPPRLLARTLAAGVAAQVDRTELLRLAPRIACLHAAGSLGEAVGALLGEGDALEGLV